MADRLTSEALDWAQRHIQRFDDTDLFPMPFEYGALQACWPSVLEYLLSQDLRSYETRPGQRFLVPKVRGLYRAGQQLDPLDALIYAAIAYEFASKVEAWRAPARVASSYRIDPQPDGRLFRTDRSEFQSRTQKLWASGTFQWIVETDLSDFYNQISHQRVRSALESAGVGTIRAESIEQFLGRVQQGQTRGLPVGPTTSILLAEVCLGDVDNYLARKDYVHVRYVDDFRIFCQTREEANRAIHDLSDYLYSVHRLGLEPSKTQFVERGTKRAKKYSDPDEPDQHVHKELSQILGDHSWAYDDLPSSTDNALRHLLGAAFQLAVTPSLKMGLTRYVLRTARRLTTPTLVGDVLANLERLGPVLRDAILYLESALGDDCDDDSVRKKIFYFADDSSSVGFLPYFRLWLSQLVIACFRETAENDARSLCRKAGIRASALLAKRFEHREWVQTHRHDWQNFGAWDRRGILWASTILSGYERLNWLSRVHKSGDPLERFLAQALMDSPDEV